MRHILQRCAMAAVLLAAPAAARSHDGFTFRDAEFMPLDDGIAAAQAFVAARLPSGLPLADARDRLRHADMRCGTPGRTGAVVCEFIEVVHVEGGVLGEELWTVRLTADAGNRLTAATVEYAVIGAGRPGL